MNKIYTQTERTDVLESVLVIDLRKTRNRKMIKERKKEHLTQNETTSPTWTYPNSLSRPSRRAQRPWCPYTVTRTGLGIVNTLLPLPSYVNNSTLDDQHSVWCGRSSTMGLTRDLIGQLLRRFHGETPVMRNSHPKELIFVFPSQSNDKLTSDLTTVRVPTLK